MTKGGALLSTPQTVDKVPAPWPEFLLYEKTKHFLQNEFFFVLRKMIADMSGTVCKCDCGVTFCTAVRWLARPQYNMVINATIGGEWLYHNLLVNVLAVQNGWKYGHRRSTVVPQPAGLHTRSTKW